MIALENLEKYFEDHPELADHKDAVLTAAREKVEKNTTILVGSAAADVLGDLADDFFREIQKDPEHQNLATEAFRAFNNR